ncbi:MAG: hypothetical protein HRT35_10080 [Algicola sp.]|nr:hypothetical protein [Algicola sp.]
MRQEYFWIISIALSSLALIASLGAIMYTYKRAKTSDIQSLLEKKTDIIILTSELQDYISELLLVVAQKIILIQEHPELSSKMNNENERLRGNLELLREQWEYIANARQQLLAQKATDLESWESMKSTFSSWLNNVKSDIKKEQKLFDELKESTNRS